MHDPRDRAEFEREEIAMRQDIMENGPPPYSQGEVLNYLFGQVAALRVKIRRLEQPREG